MMLKKEKNARRSTRPSLSASLLMEGDRPSKPSKAQAQIYAQISRGLTDVLNEYELLGDLAGGSLDPSRSAGAINKSAASLLPASLAQSAGLAQSLTLGGNEGDENSAGASDKLKQALMRTLATKRAKLQTFYQRKRQLKLLEKRQKAQEKALKGES